MKACFNCCHPYTNVNIIASNCAARFRELKPGENKHWFRRNNFVSTVCCLAQKLTLVIAA